MSNVGYQKYLYYSNFLSILHRSKQKNFDLSSTLKKKQRQSKKPQKSHFLARSRVIIEPKKKIIKKYFSLDLPVPREYHNEGIEKQ